MEFHVCAKLDYEGKIQSVQSCCTPSPQTESKRWPGCDTDFFNQLAGKVPNQETKLVPYAEKKELVYKMDAKVDQMSEIVIQLDELNKRVKVQEKLIKQYEEKIGMQENRIKQLEYENALLKDRSKDLMRMRASDEHLSVTIPKYISKDWPAEWNEQQSTKSFSWPSRKAAHTTTRNSVGSVENDTGIKKSSLDDVDGPIYEFEHRNNVHRPNTLNIGVDISSRGISEKDLDVECHFNTCKRDGNIKNGYSYVKKDVYLNVKSSEVPCQSYTVNKKSNPHEFKHVSSTSSLGFGDQNEYLDMNPQFTLDDLDKSEMSYSDNCRELANDITLCEEAVHGFWRDNQIVYHKNQSEECVESPSDKYISNDGYIRPEVHDVHNYVDIIDNSFANEDSDRPPLPLPRQRSSSLVTSASRQPDTCQQSNNNRRPMSSSSSFSNSSTSSDQSPTIQQRDIRKMSMPVSCLEHDMQLLRDKRPTNSRSTRSADRSPVRSEHRGEWKLGSPTSARNSKESNRDRNVESRKDDRLNKLLKDMRTTMEWNEAKKKLILKKEQTTEQVEEKFRTFVEDMFEAFCQLQKERAKQMQTCSRDTLLNKISDKMGTPLAREIISEAFMNKCLDFLILTCKLPSP